jgi:NADPH:quinone reductase
MWIVFATAYGSLVDRAGMRAGDYVLITAASSAVGLAAIQTANHVGAIPIAVTRHADKKDALVKAGARHVIAADDGDVAGTARDLTGGAGADIILDSVAGPGLAGLSNALKDNGTIVVLGWLDTRPALLPMHWPLTVIGYVNYEHTLNPDMVRRIAAFLEAGLTAGTLSPAIARVFDLEHIVDAHRYLESGDRLGKVVVTT